MPLVATKLRPPLLRDGLVPRERLARALDAASRLIVVSAPPGYGKSTAVAEWLASSRVAHGWLSLDAADNDAARFFRYLTAAARIAAGLPPLADDDQGGTATDLDLAIVDVVETLGGGRPDAGNTPRRVLVLDDYHLIEARPVQDAVSLLVERLPENARLAIATRADPPLPLSRLRARGQLCELRAADLRFTPQEAAAVLAVVEGLGESDVATVTARTEGWPAALQLAALALRGRPDAGDAATRFGASHRFVLDFVADEVLGGLRPELHEFLLETSILDRLCGELCDAVTGGSGGSARLAEIEAANLLLVPLDDERRWYRYHALFADILRARLAAARPHLVAELHVRAAEWLENRGEMDEAFEHAVRGGDFDRGRRLFRVRWHALAHAGELGTVRRWLGLLPQDAVRADPQLCAAYAWLLMLTGDNDGVIPWLDAAEAALEGHDIEPIDRLVVPTQIASLRSRMALLAGDPERAVEHARAAVAAVPETLPRADRQLFQGDATFMLAHALRAEGDVPAALATYREALPLLREGGNWIAAGYCVTSLVRLELRAGRPREALALCEEALAASAGAPVSTLAAVRVALAEALLAAGDAERASVEAASGADLARRAGQRVTLTDAEAVLARARSAVPRVSRASAAASNLVEPLTARELEVLRLVAAGRSNRQIAAELFVTLGTAKVHVHSIAQKLGAANRVEAIVRARELGLLD